MKTFRLGETKTNIEAGSKMQHEKMTMLGVRRQRNPGWILGRGERLSMEFIQLLNLYHVWVKRSKA
jgi:hypothetical protein